MITIIELVAQSFGRIIIDLQDNILLLLLFLFVVVADLCLLLNNIDFICQNIKTT